MKLGTSASSFLVCIPTTHVQVYLSSPMDTTAGRCMGGRISDLCVLRAPRVQEAECCPSKDCTFGSLLPLLSITNSSPAFVQGPLFSIPVITDIFCRFPARLPAMKTALCHSCWFIGGARDLCAKLWERAL